MAAAIFAKDRVEYVDERKDYSEVRNVAFGPAGSVVHLRLDTDVVGWFRAQGRGHLTHMNAVLHAYADAHR